MRELKFRVWDAVNKKMIVLNNHASSDTLFMTLDGHFFKDGVKQDYIPLQFTGLLDKNGKEIYDGDILFYRGEERNISIRWDESGANWQFDEHGIYDDGVGRGNWDFKIGIAKDCKIIGNVYEHPHLCQN